MCYLNTHILVKTINQAAGLPTSKNKFARVCFFRLGEFKFIYCFQIKQIHALIEQSD